MEINWSTFILEIINFLVLVWVLQHFFYKPVTNIISKREKSIQDKLDEAKTTHADAESLKTRYENRLLEWNNEKTQAQQKLKTEIEIERTRLIHQLQKELEQEREKEQALQKRREEDNLHQNEQIAIQQGAAFCSYLLSSFADSEIEIKIIDFVIKELEHLPLEKINLIKSNYLEKSIPVEVYSAFNLDDHQRTKLNNSFSKLIGSPTKCNFKQNSDLVAGLNIFIGSWNLQANLYHELKGFTQFSHEII
ncbi:MAG: F0F1 ATP synthase subunit delta [Gammaproteobacteria bacterium]